MDKKKAAAAAAKTKAKPDGSQIPKPVGRRTIPKAVDTEEMRKLEKSEAMKEAQNIFKEVGRDYPDFLPKPEIQAGDSGKPVANVKVAPSRARKGMGEVGSNASTRTTQVLNTQSQKVQLQNEKSEKVKKGGSVQGVIPPGDARKQLKPTTMAAATGRVDKMPVPEKSFVPPLPPGPPPKYAQKPPLGPKPKVEVKPQKEEEPPLVELFSNKVDFGVPQKPITPQKVATTTNSATDFFSVSTSSSTTDFGIMNETETEASEIKWSEPENSDSTFGPAAPPSPPSPREPEVFKPKAQAPKIQPMGEESRLDLACKITMQSAVDPSDWPVNKKPPVNHAPYEPFQFQSGGAASVDSVYRPYNPDNDKVEHDDFASEFIKSFEVKVDYFDKPPKPETIVPSIYMPSESTSTPMPGPAAAPTNDDETKPPALDSMNSLKLVHKYPVWPHQVALHKTLSHLPSLKTLVLDDSEITWIRDLGSCLPNLITLSVVRCKLTSLDGVLALPNLENLFAANNKITSPAPLSCLGHIRFVDLSGNPVTSLDGFKFLRECSSLKCFKLTDTPLGKTPDLHKQLRLIIPSLREVQPRNATIAGDDDDVEELLCTPPPSLGPHNWYESKLKGSSNTKNTSWATTSSDSQSLSSGQELELPTPDSTSNDESWQTVSKSATTEVTSGSETQGDSPSLASEAYEGDKEFDYIAEEIEWREAEKAIRDVYIPRRVEFKQRGPTVIPSDIDEMDALLDELETSGISMSETSSLGSRERADKSSLSEEQTSDY